MKPTLLLTSLLLLTTSCRKELIGNCNDKQEFVEVTVVKRLPDLLNSFEQLTLRSISLGFFPQEGGEGIVGKINGSNGKLSVPYGRYSVFIFSSDFYELDGTLYRGAEKMETYEAYSRQYTENQTLFVQEPDPLFYAYIENFVVDQTIEALPVVLKPLVYTYRFRIAVEGMQYISNAGATVSGFYTSTFLKDQKHRTAEIASIKVTLQKENGNVQFLKGEFRSFGAHQQSDVKHKIAIALTNKETKVIELDDLTNQIKQLPQGGEIVIKQKIVIENNPDTGNGTFNPGVTDWDDIEIPLPI